MKQKKYLLTIISFILCLAVLVSCNPTQDPIEDPTDFSTTDETTTDETTTDETTTDETTDTTEKFWIRPTIYYFDSYDELRTAFSEGSLVYEEKALYNDRVYQEKYETFVDYFVNGAVFHIPKMNGVEMEFRNREGFHNLILLTTELCWLPTIWYYVLYNDQNVSVLITYPEVFGIQGLEEQPNGVEVIKQICPDAITTENYQSWERYKNVYLKELELADQTVSAVFYEFHDDPRFDVRFYYKGVFVSIVAYPEVMSDDAFWKSFSL